MVRFMMTIWSLNPLLSDIFLFLEERNAIKNLKDTQSQGHITIKEVDKGGGICIMNTDDYIMEMKAQLTAVFMNPDGTESRFYVPVKEDSLNKKKTTDEALTSPKR